MTMTYLFAKFMKKVRIPAIIDCSLKKCTKVCSGSHIVSSQIDEYSYIGNDCTVINAQIGKFCSIADNCIIGGAQHPYKWVSTSPVFMRGRNCLNVNIGKNEYSEGMQTYIGNDVWLGNNCLIKSGVSIRDGAVIGMGSVVTKDVGAYEIWGGVPARCIGKRFTEEVIEALLEITWWNDINKTKYYADKMMDVNQFIEEWKKDENSTLG